ncbi:MAG: S9 family peptidase [Enterobacterales bacterium]|nr:S9 family peptidase [Enterobacterales bacterium]
MKIMLSVLLSAMLLLVTACSAEPETGKSPKTEQSLDTGNITYPDTYRSTTEDTYFQESVADPYQWLEQSQTNATKQWLSAQKQLTTDYLARINFRDELKQNLTELWQYKSISVPSRVGDYLYFREYSGQHEQAIIYRQQDNAAPEIFLDPNMFSQDDSISLSLIRFSKTGKYAAYIITDDNSDWSKIIVLNTQTMQAIDTPLENINFSEIAWQDDDGFYYSGYKPASDKDSSALTDSQKLFYHKLGTKQSADSVIFGAGPSRQYRYISGETTDDGRFLIIQAANSTSGNKLYIKDLTKTNNRPEVVLADANSDTYVLTSDDRYLYLVTNRGAPKLKLVRMPVAQLNESAWQDVIPEAGYVLSVASAGGYLFAEYTIDALSKIIQFNFSGEKINELELPGPGSVSSIHGRPNDNHAYYSFSNYQTPPTIYQLNTETGQSRLFYKPTVNFEPEDYVSRQVFYPSKDGTLIPMMITHHKDVRLNGQNPTLLYGYGGFNISLLPSFRIEHALWLEMGGIYAVPNLRGGGENGKSWHLAGTKLQKQNVFDDFIAAAEYLIDNKYTASDYLAITGGSNGGLLVGAVITQRPDLIRVALPVAGVLDMLRYHKFTAGAGWVYEYGTAEESPEMFNYLRRYSPVHNVKPATNYPATLITTSEHDNRVVPSHSYKFAAELQAKQKSDLPVLLNIEITNRQHSERRLNNSIQRYVDIISFTLFNMGFKELPPRL